jgi:hypothetical protein
MFGLRIMTESVFYTVFQFALLNSYYYQVTPVHSILMQTENLRILYIFPRRGNPILICAVCHMATLKDFIILQIKIV